MGVIQKWKDVRSIYAILRELEPLCKQYDYYLSNPWFIFERALVIRDITPLFHQLKNKFMNVDDSVRYAEFRFLNGEMCLGNILLLIKSTLDEAREEMGDLALL